jgi:hypothetical protein
VENKYTQLIENENKTLDAPHKRSNLDLLMYACMQTCVVTFCCMPRVCDSKREDMDMYVCMHVCTLVWSRYAACLGCVTLNVHTCIHTVSPERDRVWEQGAYRKKVVFGVFEFFEVKI